MLEYEIFFNPDTKKGEKMRIKKWLLNGEKWRLPNEGRRRTDEVKMASNKQELSIFGNNGVE